MTVLSTKNFFEIGVFRQFLEDLGPDSAFLPPSKSLVNAVPIPELFGQIPPRGTGTSEPQNRLDELPIFRAAPPRVRCLARQQMLDPRPLVFA